MSSIRGLDYRSVYSFQKRVLLPMEIKSLTGRGDESRMRFLPRIDANRLKSQSINLFLKKRF